MGDFFPSAKWQRCIVHFYRNVFTVVPKGKVKGVARMLKAIHASEDKMAAREKAETVIKKLTSQKLRKAAQIVREGINN
jgi:transposase-like protein